jgi:hypothetical protein
MGAKNAAAYRPIREEIVEGQVVIMAESKPEPKPEESMPRTINIFGSNICDVVRR